MATATSLDHLPIELYNPILKYLNYDQIRNLCLVNHNFNDLCQDPIFWQTLLRLRYPMHYRDHEDPHKIFRHLEATLYHLVIELIPDHVYTFWISEMDLLAAAVIGFRLINHQTGDDLRIYFPGSDQILSEDDLTALENKYKPHCQNLIQLQEIYTTETIAEIIYYHDKIRYRVYLCDVNDDMLDFLEEIMVIIGVDNINIQYLR